MSPSNDISDIIKPYEPVETDDTPTKAVKTTPFDFMAAVSHTKKDIIGQDPDIAKDYVGYIVNKGFGFFPDTVLHANEMNLLPDIPGAAQYYYYMGSLRKRKRYSKWHKLDKDDDLRLVQEVYGVRVEVAKQYMKILTEENLADLRQSRETGESGLTKKRK